MKQYKFAVEEKLKYIKIAETKGLKIEFSFLRRI